MGSWRPGADEHQAHHFPTRFYRGVSNSDEVKKGFADHPGHNQGNSRGRIKDVVGLVSGSGLVRISKIDK